MSKNYIIIGIGILVLLLPFTSSAASADLTLKIEITGMTGVNNAFAIVSLHKDVNKPKNRVAEGLVAINKGSGTLSKYTVYLKPGKKYKIPKGIQLIPEIYIKDTQGKNPGLYKLKKSTLIKMDASKTITLNASDFEFRATPQ